MFIACLFLISALLTILTIINPFITGKCSDHFCHSGVNKRKKSSFDWIHQTIEESTGSHHLRSYKPSSKLLQTSKLGLAFCYLYISLYMLLKFQLCHFAKIKSKILLIKRALWNSSQIIILRFTVIKVSLSLVDSQQGRASSLKAPLMILNQKHGQPILRHIPSMVINHLSTTLQPFVQAEIQPSLLSVV